MYTSVIFVQTSCPIYTAVFVPALPLVWFVDQQFANVPIAAVVLRVSHLTCLCNIIIIMMYEFIIYTHTNHPQLITMSQCQDKKSKLCTQTNTLTVAHSYNSNIN